jgi:hypothetical protein
VRLLERNAAPSLAYSFTTAKPWIDDRRARFNGETTTATTNAVAPRFDSLSLSALLLDWTAASPLGEAIGTVSRLLYFSNYDEVVSSMARSSAFDWSWEADSKLPEPTHGSVDLVVYIHDNSGLTWEQIARALGVSKRSVHLWASGARVSGKNVEALTGFKALVDSVGGKSPDDRRMALLSSSPDAASPLTRWAKSLAQTRSNVNAPVLRAADLMG